MKNEELRMENWELRNFSSTESMENWEWRMENEEWRMKNGEIQKEKSMQKKEKYIFMQLFILIINNCSLSPNNFFVWRVKRKHKKE